MHINLEGLKKFAWKKNLYGYKIKNMENNIENRWQQYRFETLERTNYDNDIVHMVNDINYKNLVTTGIDWADKHTINQWHDLINNPTDLPQINEQVLVITNNKHNKVTLSRLYVEKDVYGNVIDLRPKWCGSDAFASSIIGWMQIPEFK